MMRKVPISPMLLDLHSSDVLFPGSEGYSRVRKVYTQVDESPLVYRHILLVSASLSVNLTVSHRSELLSP